MAILAFQKPDKVLMLEADSRFGKFEFRPLEPGFGITVGNALRRILLSSLEGFAITTIRIDGVEHEFSSVPGVKEDVTNIILNLKQVRFKQVVEEFESEKVSITVENSSEFKAGDIGKYLTGFEVLNPELVICHLDSKSTMQIDITINKGRGYVPADENREYCTDVNVIPIDSIYTPIRNVKYAVENFRVEQKTDYEKLVLEISTDGSIHPNTAAAYFALFQKLNNYLIFDPLNNKDDVKCFAAVATSLNNAFPHAVRSKNLYNIVIKGMKNTRQPQTKALEIPQDKIVETGIIDIALRDVKGNVRKLTDLKGKVVLLDFSVFQSPAGAPHNLMLRELYNEYAKQGLEIYQVSLDADEHYWKTAADNLPWVCVRDGNGVYSTNVAVYNVRQVPSIFLINRNNELKLRGEDIKDLEAAVKSLL